ncbi:MAG: LysR family transcriptional regulator [Xanthomonadales bacterium]|nr:LysR family transcriptional regulator [Gammaproteobacteria bacterium]MBT8049679.1 LysR family transcriptional regulator [Gammaproteobacteria bacterium]MBT8055345.1 LysR family transcriptional regulator [Gammaproteobacteria bacterium]NNJ79733.1 LysR family transcriptional regulator [Xanthomonadales bacterium]NNL05305.1 LysR family transcriptional regulator [Xanthomonadales bacterium]
MTDAAEQLYLSQPAISLQIRALERELDTVLFERHGPRINLTREGQELFEMARPLVAGLESLNTRFNRRMKGDLDSGEVIIAAGESTIIYLMPQLVQLFREKYPNIHVQLRNVTGRDGLAMIRDDEVDFAVGSMLDVPSDINYQPVYSFEPALIMPIGHPLADSERVAIEDIAPYGLILPPRRLTTWRMVDRVFQQHQVPFNVTLEVGGWEVIKRYVELDFGISIVTGICLRDDDKLVAKNMSDYFPKRSYGTVMRRGKYLSPQARAFLEVTEEASLADSTWSSQQKND